MYLPHSRCWPVSPVPLALLTRSLVQMFPKESNNSNVNIHVKPGNKNKKLGSLGDFEFVVDYASMISLWFHTCTQYMYLSVIKLPT